MARLLPREAEGWNVAPMPSCERSRSFRDRSAPWVGAEEAEPSVSLGPLCPGPRSLPLFLDFPGWAESSLAELGGEA